MLSAQQYEQYNRQILLQEFGENGQQKLLNAKVLMIGAGGLGCPILQYLVAAGIGTIGIVDEDVVSISNLHRQILYGWNDIGKLKAVVAAEKLQQLNPNLLVNILAERLINTNAWEIILHYDVIIDGSDNFATRYLVNDVCVLQNKALIYGSIYKFEGQLAVCNIGENATNYRDIFPVQPSINEVPNCSEIGVIGILPGIIGCMMANETIKIIAGIGITLCNRLLTYNSLDNTFFEIEVLPNDNARKLLPKNRVELEQTLYEEVCDLVQSEISIEHFDELITNNNITIIDVREYGETPTITEFKHFQIPLSQIKKGVQLKANAAIVVFCQSGIRSKQAAELLVKQNTSIQNINSLKGGIISWKNHHYQTKD